VPARTNDFQELVTALTQILGNDKTLAPAMLPDRAIPGAVREVDICAEGEIAGHKVLLGIECRAWKRPQTAEWVEVMHGKHSHLPTSKLVLVSSSGFRPNALKLAEFLGIKAITPSEVKPGFVGEIVNNLDSVWMKRFDFTPEQMTIVFDPPITYPMVMWRTASMESPWIPFFTAPIRRRLEQPEICCKADCATST